jgi:hypothetical protein
MVAHWPGNGTSALDLGLSCEDVPRSTSGPAPHVVPGQRASARAWTLPRPALTSRPCIKECERRLARYQTALDAGADPAVVTGWINDAQRDRQAAQTKFDSLPALTRKTEPPLTPDEIREITERLGDIAQRIQVADADKKGPLYDALGISINYDNASKDRDRKVEALACVSLLRVSEGRVDS